MRFDLLIKGGHVVDPASAWDGPLDVALAAGAVAATDANIPEDSAYRVIDARGRYVIPGLIDLHTHVFHDFTYWGLDRTADGRDHLGRRELRGRDHAPGLPALHRRPGAGADQGLPQTSPTSG